MSCGKISSLEFELRTSQLYVCDEFKQWLPVFFKKK